MILKKTDQTKPVAKQNSNVLDFPIIRIGVNKSIAGMWPKYKAVAKN